MAVDQAMVEAEGEEHDVTDDDLIAAHDGLSLHLVDAQDRCLGEMDDGGGEEAALLAEGGDGEGASGTVSQSLEAKIRWFGTLRVRGGVLITPTVWLYGTGGLAYGDVSVSDTITVSGVGTTAFSKSKTNVGWTLGAGVEGAIPNSRDWTWKVEYLYLDLGSLSGGGTDPTIGNFSWNARFTDNIVRVGLNYRFH